MKSRQYTKFEKLCTSINKYFSWMLKGMNVEWDKDLEKAVTFTRLKVDAREIVSTAWICTFWVILATLLLSGTITYYGGDFITPLVVGLTLALLILYYIPLHPKRLASSKKMKAVGGAPEIVAYMIIPLKQNPNLEEAVKFAAEHGEGEMADDLKRALKDVWAGKYTGIGEALPVLGRKWGSEIKGFEDAMYAIRTSQIEKSETRRLNTLDRALESILDSIQKKFEMFIGYLRIPTMVLFMGGAIFPLVIITLIPLISFLGMGFGTPSNIFLVLIAIVAGVFLYSDYTLDKRPASFSPIEIPDDYPGLPPKGKIKLRGRYVSVIWLSVSTALLISLLSLPYLTGYSLPLFNEINTLAVVAGVSAGLWIFFHGTSKPKKEIRDSISDTENDTIEAAFQLGNRLMSGMAAEDAFIRVGNMMSEPGGEGKSQISGIFKKGVRNIRYMNMTLEDALFDPDKGALKDIHSGMIRSIFKIFTISMKKSIRAASDALITGANHIREIKRVEDRLKEKISYTMSMMKMTATVISPAICALTIYIAETFRKNVYSTSASNPFGSGISGGLLLKAPTTTPEMLQLIVGIYMILLMMVLIRYVTILENGDDRVLVRLEIAKGIPVALLVFIGVLSISRLFS